MPPQPAAPPPQTMKSSRQLPLCSTLQGGRSCIPTTLQPPPPPMPAEPAPPSQTPSINREAHKTQYKKITCCVEALFELDAVGGGHALASGGVPLHPGGAGGREGAVIQQEQSAPRGAGVALMHGQSAPRGG